MTSPPLDTLGRCNSFANISKILIENAQSFDRLPLHAAALDPRLALEGEPRRVKRLALGAGRAELRVVGVPELKDELWVVYAKDEGVGHLGHPFSALAFPTKASMWIMSNIHAKKCFAPSFATFTEDDIHFHVSYFTIHLGQPHYFSVSRSSFV